MKINKELLKGTSDLLILRVLEKQPLHGYHIAKTIQQLSDRVLTMGEGTLYPILHRLERDGLLEAFWQEVDGRKRKYYSLTQRGRTVVQEKTTEWNVFSQAIKNIVS